MAEQNLNQDAVEAAAKRLYDQYGKGQWDGEWEHLHPRIRAEYCTLVEDVASSYLSALPAQSIQAIVSKSQLMELPIGTIVRGFDGTVLRRTEMQVGVGFEEDQVFPWDEVPLPAFIIPLPELPQ